MCSDCRERIGEELWRRIETFNRVWPDAQFGPAHIVLGDYNADRPSVQWCLDHFEEFGRDRDLEELQATRNFLTELLQYWKEKTG